MSPSKFRHKWIAVGGTFDQVHIGHVSLLTRAFELGEVVFIGVTSDSLVKRLHKQHRVHSFATRTRGIRRFLRSRGWIARARVVQLNDPFGPATRRKRLDALVVSEDTRSSGKRVNALRGLRNLPALRIYVVKMVNAEDNAPVCTTRIVRREINGRGK